jgi:hypothetical protein
MRLSLIVTLLVTGILALGQAMPRMTICEPGNGKVADVLTVSGENLGKAAVAKLFLTDGKNDIPVEIVDQADAAIKFKLPEKSGGARWSLMLLTTGKEPKLIEQPVKVTVE